MASTLHQSSSSSSNSFVHLHALKEQFWNSHPNLSEAERQERWIQAVLTPTDPQPSNHHQTPRSMTFSPSEMNQLSTSGLNTMDRTRSAPSTCGSISTTTLDSSTLQRSATTYSDWQSMSQEQPNEYMLCNSAPFTNNSVVEYSPDDFVTACIEPPSPSYPLPLPQSSQHLQLTAPTLQWSTSSDGSTSPSTPSTALMTPVTQGNSMSRQSSYNPHFFDTVSMMRVPSDSSCLLPILPEDNVFSFSSYPVESKTISNSVDTSHFLFSTGSAASGHFLSPSASSSSYSVAASAQALASPSSSPFIITQQQPDLAEDMRRSASASSSDASSAPSSTCSRQSRREREINAQAASRKLAPKAYDAPEDTLLEAASLSSNNATMTSIQSEDGTSKTVGVLPKTPYVRPQHPKIMCAYCAGRPEGFRGTHELDRHIARAHAVRRKGYICVDYSSDGKFLANCKHCRGKKVYGAYYNAAAHLRRAHFHPRKRGRKGKNDEKRGGIGGGDHPAMDYLKQHWIKEIEVANKPAPLTPESAEDDGEADAERSEAMYERGDAAYSRRESLYSDEDALYSSAPQSAIEGDGTGYMAYGMSMSSHPMSMMQATEPMMLYEGGGASGYATGFEDGSGSISGAGDFQFDAYMAQ